MLNLPVPEAEFINEVLKPSEEQQEMVGAFSERAESVRAGLVNPTEDNMLKITNDGRKCALDQRLLNELLPDDETSKVNTCVKNAYQVWEEGKADRTTQLIFCDLSTPKGDGSFNVYDDVREKLVARGVPKEEVAFIHEYNTEAKKSRPFCKGKSRAGENPDGFHSETWCRYQCAGPLDCLTPSGLSVEAVRCRTDFADIQNKKECGGNRQWQNHYLRNWAANTKGKGII